MSGQTEALIVVVTWGILLILYILNRYLIKDSIVRHSTKVLLPREPNRTNKPGDLLSKAGVLFVFMVNITTFFIVFAAALSPSVDQNLALIKVDLPMWINIFGSILFLMDNIWGFFALVFNPNYTPLYKSPSPQFILATRGPYGIIRHPRYASEAFLNIALFMFTGIWLPLLGLIGWIAIYYQACAEESYLMKLAPNDYGEYRKKTGMFFPKLTRRET
jgi:protein-S-isoprenylcysteine O-methyltransferase Ste14